MKFIVFNIVVAVALIFLVANKTGDVDLSLPQFDKVSASAAQLLGRDRTAPPAEPAEAPAATPSNPFSLVPDADVAAAPPAPPVDVPTAVGPTGTAPVVDAPVIDAADLVSPAGEPSAATTPAVAGPPRLDPAVAQRRAEVLGEGSLAPRTPAQPTADRRQQLLDLAEEMEYMAAEFAVR